MMDEKYTYFIFQDFKGFGRDEQIFYENLSAFTFRTACPTFDTFSLRHNNRIMTSFILKSGMSFMLCSALSYSFFPCFLRKKTPDSISERRIPKNPRAGVP